MEDEQETVAAGGHVSAAVSGPAESASSTLPAATDVNTDTDDVSVAMSTASETEQQHL